MGNTQFDLGDRDNDGRNSYHNGHVDIVTASPTFLCTSECCSGVETVMCGGSDAKPCDVYQRAWGVNWFMPGLLLRLRRLGRDGPGNWILIIRLGFDFWSMVDLIRYPGQISVGFGGCGNGARQLRDVQWGCRGMRLGGRKRYCVWTICGDLQCLGYRPDEVGPTERVATAG